MNVKKPHIGQFYIYTLQVIEFFLEGISKYPELEGNIIKFIENDINIEEFCDEFVNKMKNEVIMTKTDKGKINIEKTSAKDLNKIILHMHNRFSYNKISEIMFGNKQNKTQVSNYMNTYLKQFNALSKDEYKKFCFYDKDIDCLDELKKDAEKLFPDISKKIEEKIEILCNKPLKADEKLVVWNELAKFVIYTTQESDFFDNRIFIYYLFFEWHTLDINLITKMINNENITLDYADELTRITSQLISTRISVDHKETRQLLDEYFFFYAKFIANIEVFNGLQYSLYNCVDYINKPETAYLLMKDLCYIFHNSFSFKKPSEGIPIYKSFLETGNQKALYHYPQSSKNDQDILDWKQSFEDSFPEILKRENRLDKLLDKIDKNDYPNNELYEIMQSSLRYASPIPKNSGGQTSNIIHFKHSAETTCGIDFNIPYISIIDSPSNHLYSYSDFEFVPDREYLSPKPDLGVFDQLNILEDLKKDAQEKVQRAGRDGISERKTVIYNSVIQPDNSHFTMKVGKIDFFTGVSRRDFFINFLAPSSTNISKLLFKLVENKLLEEYLPTDINAKLLSLAFIDNPELTGSIIKYNKTTKTNNTKTQRELLIRIMSIDKDIHEKFYNILINTENNQDDLDVFKNAIYDIKEGMKKNINELYDIYVSNNNKKLNNGAFEIGNTGTSFTGGGIFVLTTEIGSDGKDRPWLILQRRWKVSEVSGSLSYSSSGSGNMYDPDDYSDRAKKAYQKYDILCEREKIDEYVFSQEAEWDLEANPFLAAARELKEELRIKVQPHQLDLICFGVDLTLNLHQFSFLYKSENSAVEILKRAAIAHDSDEGIAFIIPFKKEVIDVILNNYLIEISAIYSLTRLVEIKKDLLWDSENE